MSNQLLQTNQSLESLKNQEMPESQEDQLQIKLIRDFATIMAVGILFGIIFDTTLAVIASNWLPLIDTGLCVGVLVLIVIARQLAQPGNSLLQARRGAEMIVIGTLIVITSVRITTGSQSGSNMSYLLIIIITGVLGLGFRESLIFAIISFLCLSIPFALEKIFTVYKVPTELDLQHYPWFDLSIWWLGLVVTFALIVPFTRRYRKTVERLAEQSALLHDLLITVNSSTEFGSSISKELSTITNDLTSTSSQQVSNSQMQVSAVNEVTISLEELSETAQQIANAANAATASTARTVNIAEEVKEASTLATSAIHQGAEAVEQTISSVERVRNRIEQLAQRLLNLTEQTRRVGSIIDLIDEIADETHLLALNASIEAAGKPAEDNDTSGSNSKRGERFGVIAQEIKNLADRSRESTEEVRDAISEMQGAVAAAVLVAEEGKKETANAVSRSQISGVVIQKLNDVILNSSQQAEGILQAVEEVNTRCDEISIATNQQRTANQQILGTMRSVVEVARENAGTVYHISETMGRVNNRLDELNDLLSQSNQTSQRLQPALN